MSRRNRYGTRGVLKPLPTEPILSESSLEWSNHDDDFDKLFNAKAYKSIVYQREGCENTFKSSPNSSDSSPCILFHSPTKHGPARRKKATTLRSRKSVVSVATSTGAEVSEAAVSHLAEVNTGQRTIRARAVLAQSPAFKRPVDLSVKTPPAKHASPDGAAVLTNNDGCDNVSISPEQCVTGNASAVITGNISGVCARSAGSDSALGAVTASTPFVPKGTAASAGLFLADISPLMMKSPGNHSNHNSSSTRMDTESGDNRRLSSPWRLDLSEVIGRVSQSNSRSTTRDSCDAHQTSGIAGNSRSSVGNSSDSGEVRHNHRKENAGKSTSADDMKNGLTVSCSPKEVTGDARLSSEDGGRYIPQDIHSDCDLASSKPPASDVRSIADGGILSNESCSAGSIGSSPIITRRLRTRSSRALKSSRKSSPVVSTEADSHQKAALLQWRSPGPILSSESSGSSVAYQSAVDDLDCSALVSGGVSGQCVVDLSLLSDSFVDVAVRGETAVQQHDSPVSAVGQEPSCFTEDSANRSSASFIPAAASHTSSADVDPAATSAIAEVDRVASPQSPAASTVSRISAAGADNGAAAALPPCSPLLAVRCGKGWRRSLIVCLSPLKAAGDVSTRRMSGIARHSASTSTGRLRARQSCFTAAKQAPSYHRRQTLHRFTHTHGALQEESETSQSAESSTDKRRRRSLLDGRLKQLSGADSDGRLSVASNTAAHRRCHGDVSLKQYLSPGQRVRRRSSFCVTSASDLKLTANTTNATCVSSSPNIIMSPTEARQTVLDLCQNSEIVSFSAFIKQIRITKKVGEGVYGEVFLCKASNTTSSDISALSVVKIMPIEGSLIVNGSTQKSFAEILSELIISRHLSALRDECDGFCTSGFVRLISSHVVQGKYPYHLRQQWLQYDKEKGSENDDPSCFDGDQLFLILQYEHVGSDLENFIFDSADQALSVFLQVAYSLAVAERRLQFEHRDLHWGNVLVRRTSSLDDNSTTTDANIQLNHGAIDLPSSGVCATLIDFTLSRMTSDDRVIYNNLAEDEELFNSYGDYQFDIYRQMRQTTDDEWWRYSPRTNVLWLHYLWCKLFGGDVAFTNSTSRTHRSHMRHLSRWRDVITTADSATQFVQQFGSDLILEMTVVKQ